MWRNAVAIGSSLAQSLFHTEEVECFPHSGMRRLLLCLGLFSCGLVFLLRGRLDEVRAAVPQLEQLVPVDLLVQLQDTWQGWENYTITVEPQAVKKPTLEDALRQHAGIYLNKSHAPELKDVLLLTAANSGYLNMLQNWECFAKKLGLDWFVIAMDENLHRTLGPERSFLSLGEQHDSSERFGTVGFRTVACNKLRSIAHVLAVTQLDLVFTDSDNVFKTDPFLPSLTLGSMMRSGKFEYIYGRKIQPPGPRPGEYHEEPPKANTGFYYVSGARKPRVVQSLFNLSVEWCDRRPGLDDQENFWDALATIRKKKAHEKGYIGCFRHCENEKCSDVEELSVLNYCDMSPYEYVLGSVDPRLAQQEPYHLVTYHATHVWGKDQKKQKLQKAQLWDDVCQQAAQAALNASATEASHV
ncbi:unnamed protein product [Symbiodinium natans]|uniref:Nucleotide-diphospho-sugar transferase domain-containing protein n=1 Tax=Symbiodinium natans TaxID=878477 RepID=A0A812KVN7_9DINO|nr:unnamed protein product [Symbiodinium natans]